MLFLAFYLLIQPLAFLVEFLLSCGLVLKGTWILQTGLSLYIDAFGLGLSLRFFFAY